MASEESTPDCSLPLTLRVRTEPARMPTESVARSSKRRGEAAAADALEQMSEKCYSVCPLVSHNLIVVRCCAPDCVRGLNLKYSRCSLPLLHLRRDGFTRCLDAKYWQKSSVSSVRVGGEWNGCRKQFGEGDSREDEGRSQERAAAKMFVQDEVGSQTCEDRFEGEKDGGVGGRKMLLGPALDGEGGGGGEEAGDGECDDEAWGDGQVGSSA